jgi:hypothetical protein
VGNRRAAVLKQGKVGISGFHLPDQLIDIAVELAGSLADAMAIIGHPKLQFDSGIGLKPDGINGDGDIALKFQFPLQNSLRLADVATKVRAKMAKAVVPNLVNQHGVSDGNLTLDLGQQRHGGGGSGQNPAGAPMEIKWAGVVCANSQRDGGGANRAVIHAGGCASCKARRQIHQSRPKSPKHPRSNPHPAPCSCSGISPLTARWIRKLSPPGIACQRFAGGGDAAERPLSGF